MADRVVGLGRADGEVGGVLLCRVDFSWLAGSQSGRRLGRALSRSARDHFHQALHISGPTAMCAPRSATTGHAGAVSFTSASTNPPPSSPGLPLNSGGEAVVTASVTF